MRELVGLLLTHAILIAVGVSFLRAFGLLAPGWRPFAVAIGPAFLLGACLVMLSICVLLSIGVPFTLWTVLVVSAAWSAAGWALARRRSPPATPAPDGSISPTVRLARRLVVALFAAYAVFGAWAESRLPTVSDDARIWSLKGLALTYYDTLRPEVFSSSFVTRAHPVYPLLQPVFEATLSRAMGHPQLRWFHAELWLLSGAALWTAAFLISRTRPGSRAMLAWLPVLGLLIVTPESLLNLGIGYADITGSILLGTGALALGLWFERGEDGYLAVATVLLAAAANTKDEDLIGACVVLVVALVALLVRRRGGRLATFVAAVGVFAMFVAPWRIWVSAHHLSDSVEPPLPRALSPIYVLDRLHELHLSATAMVSTVISGFPWLGPVFLATCVICLFTATARRTACFYLGTFVAIIVALLWLYTTTPVSLGFLIPTSMDRTVSVFMVLSGFAAAHLISVLAGVPVRSQAASTVRA
jgi:hypothetical protein